MAIGPLEIVAGYLDRLAHALDAKPDAEVLEFYAVSRNEEAFAEIVRRHGPMVLGVCRRALGTSTDADDAFQATFLHLARNAKKVRTCVPGWLFRVAVRSSRRLQRTRSRASAIEEKQDFNDPYATVEWSEIRCHLDEELARLPAKWQSPLTLCYLEGLTRDEAASRLGLSLRTLHRRLDEGRSRLRIRLEKRGLSSALLASFILPCSDLCAAISSQLAGRTISQAVSAMDAPASIRALASNTTIGGNVMKATLCAAILIAGTIAFVEHNQPVSADPLPAPRLPVTSLAMAPQQKERPAEDPLTKNVRKAQSKGIEFIKNQQKENEKGVWNWENQKAPLAGGTTSLAILALLESGLKADDEVVSRGLKYLRTVKPQHTYVVSLQTQVLCKANQKQDAELIKTNVKWLEDAAARDAAGLKGWSYTGAAGGRADNSNTRYAISALHAAHEAGFKLANEKFWQEVRAAYVQSQLASGGWGYMNGVPGLKPTHTMTCSGLLCLTHAEFVIGKQDDATVQAMKNGFGWVAKEFNIENQPHTFYNLDVIAELGRASAKSDFGGKDKKREWFKDGGEWLLKKQKPNGEWSIEKAADANAIVSTSFALRFLASKPE